MNWQQPPQQQRCKFANFVGQESLWTYLFSTHEKKQLALWERLKQNSARWVVSFLKNGYPFVGKLSHLTIFFNWVETTTKSVIEHSSNNIPRWIPSLELSKETSKYLLTVWCWHNFSGSKCCSSQQVLWMCRVCWIEQWKKTTSFLFWGYIGDDATQLCGESL